MLKLPPEWPDQTTDKSFQSRMAQLLTYFRTGDGFGCIVMELVDGVTLKEYAASLSPLEKEVALREVARQLAMSLAYMHEAGWAHCDIKPNSRWQTERERERE